MYPKFFETKPHSNAFIDIDAPPKKIKKRKLPPFSFFQCSKLSKDRTPPKPQGLTEKEVKKAKKLINECMERIHEGKRLLAEENSKTPIAKCTSFAHQQAAVCYESLGQYDVSLELYGALILVDPENDNYWQRAGYLFLKLEEYPKAFYCFTHALNIDGSDIVSQHGRAVASKSLQDFPDSALNKSSTTSEEEVTQSTENPALDDTPHPGPTLKKIILGIEGTAKAAADTLGVQELTLSHLFRGVSRFTDDMAVLMEQKYGRSFDVELKMQWDRNKASARQRLFQKQKTAVAPENSQA